MTFFRWLGGFIFLFWMISLIFKIGGTLANILLLISGAIFAIDLILDKKSSI